MCTSIVCSQDVYFHSNNGNVYHYISCGALRCANISMYEKNNPCMCTLLNVWSSVMFASCIMLFDYQNLIRNSYQPNCLKRWWMTLLSASCRSWPTGSTVSTGRERLRSYDQSNGGRRTRWVQTFADCVNMAPRSPSILRTERIMGPIDFLGVRNCSGMVGYCRYREGKISANWS